MSDSVPVGYELVKATFGEGSLGVTLRKVKETGKVTVLEVVEGSQAVHLDVAVKDEIWAVGPVELGSTRVDEEVWKSLLQFMKTNRPLEITFLRKSSSRPSSPLTASDTIPPPPATTVQTTPVIATTQAPQKPPPPPAPTTNSPPPTKALSPDLQALFHKISIKGHPLGALGKLMTHSVSDDDKRIFLKDNGIDLFKADQCIYYEGEVGLLGSFALWNMQKRRYLVLLADVLVIFVMSAVNVLEYESTIDVFSCKLMNHVRTGDLLNDRLSFDIHLDGEDINSIRIVCRNEDDKDRWVDAIVDRIFELWGKPDTFAWKHSYVLGSIHAKVVAGDYDAVKELVSLCDSGQMDYADLEPKDSQGVTPLIYGTLLKKTKIVDLLLHTNPDVTVTDAHGLTCLHWAALHLDATILQLICDHVLESDVDMPDSLGRSALFLACSEGKTEEGVSDAEALASCITSLVELSADGNIEVAGTKGFPLHYLAASWQDLPIHALLKGKALVNAVNSEGMTALQLACRGVPLRTSANEMTRLLFGTVGRADILEPVDKDGCMRTLEVLLKAGARPNVKEPAGKTALQYLIDAEEVWGGDVFDAIEILVSFGARCDDPQLAADLKATCPPGFLEGALANWTNRETPEIGNIGLQHNCFAGDSAEKADKTCALCETPFTLFRHKHKCNLCGLYVCDDCSKKKCTIEDTPNRACDCCFNRASQKVAEAKEKAFASSFRSTTGVSQRPATLESKAQLFAGSLTESKRSTEPASSNVSKTMSTMNEAYQNLQKRGEQLEQTAEKSEQLKNASAEFANLAKQLKDKQKRSWFS